MTSTTSNYNKFGIAFKRAVKNNIVGSVIVFVLCITVSVVSYLSDVCNTAFKNYDMSEDLVVMLGFISIITGVYCILNAPNMFKEIYKKQSCDTYFALPIKRENYFCANWLYGALFNTVCYVASGAIFAILMHCDSRMNANISTDFAVKYIAMLLALVSMYSAFVMCAVVAGKRVQYIFMALICLLLPSSVTSGVVSCIMSIWGMPYNALGYVNTISPVVNTIDTAFYQNVLPMLIVSVVEMVLTFTVGLKIFKNRKAEIAEMSLANNVLPYVLLAVVVASGYYSVNLGNTAVKIAISIAVGVLAAIIFNAIFYKKVFNESTLKVTVATLIVCVVLTIVPISPLVNSYVNKVPKADDVKSVTVTDTYSNTYYTGLLSLVNEIYSEDGDTTFTLTEKDDIQKVIDLQKKSIAKSTITKSRNNYESILSYLIDGDSYPDRLEYTISYTLKSGKTINRTYSVSTDCVKNEILALYNAKSAKISMVENYIDWDNVICLDPSVFGSSNSDYCEVVNGNTLKNALKKDFVSYKFKNAEFDLGINSRADDEDNILSDASIYVVNGNRDTIVEQYKKSGQKDFVAWANDNNIQYSQYYITILTTDANTIAYLKSLNNN